MTHGFKPMISVIVPVFNGEKYLEEFLDSLHTQTLRNIEILLVNDGSTDSTPDILESFCQKDYRARVITQEQQGAGAARNAGYDLAQGEYLSFLDADDILNTRMLEKMLARARNTGADVVFCRCDGLDAMTGRKFNMDWALRLGQIMSMTDGYFSNADLKHTAFRFCNGWAWDKLFKHEFVKSNNLRFQHLPYANDAYFVRMAVILAERMAVVEDCLITHRMRDKSSVSNSRETAPEIFYEMLKGIRDGLVERGLYESEKKGFHTRVTDYVTWHYDTMCEPHKYKLRSFLRKVVLPDFGLSDPPDGFSYTPELEPGIRAICWDRHFKAPKVSIIVAGQDAAHRVEACLERILYQSYDDLEILFIDCGSTDSTVDLVKTMVEQDHRLRVFTHGLAAGATMGEAFNFGMELATGAYVAFCEATELMPFTAVENLLRNALETKSDVVLAAPLPPLANEQLGKIISGNTVRYDVEARERNMRLSSCLEKHAHSRALYKHSLLKQCQANFSDSTTVNYAIPFRLGCVLSARKISVADPGGDYKYEKVKPETGPLFSAAKAAKPLHEAVQWLESAKLWSQGGVGHLLAAALRSLPELCKQAPARYRPELFKELKSFFSCFKTEDLLYATEEIINSPSASRLVFAIHYDAEQDFLRELTPNMKAK